MILAFKREKERMVVNAILFAGAHVFLAAFLLGAFVPYYISVLGFLLSRFYDKSGSVLYCVGRTEQWSGIHYRVREPEIDPG